jgi:ankyrin repeat protein
MVISIRRIGFAVVLAAATAMGLLQASPAAPLADAAERGDTVAVRNLLLRHADVNAAQPDGMTALHWAALNGDAKLVDVLVAAKAKVDPVTRLGEYTPLHLAAERGHGAVVTRLLTAGSNATAVTTTGVQPIHFAADAGSVESVRALLDKGVDVNVKDATHGRTALIFAASKSRIDAMKLLISRGASVAATTTVIDYVARSRTDGADRSASLRASGAGVRGAGSRGAGGGGAAGPGRGGAGAGANGAGAAAAATAYDPTADPDPNAVYAQVGRGGRGGGRGPSDPEIIGKQGGLTALHYAARDGYADAVAVLLDAKIDVNTRTAGDLSTPLVVAVVNGNFDIAMALLARGADPNLTNDDGIAPLFATLNNEWALRTWYPQPTAATQQKTSYLQLMEKLLVGGADPNARTITHVWFAAYNAGRMGVDFAGATPFWRAAYALDLEAMRLLVKYGADPNIPTVSYGSPRRPNDPSGLESVPAGGPHVPAFHAAMGVGYGTSRVAQQHHHVPDGWMPAARYFVEELKVDVNMRDAEGFTALHHAAARGDNEMILYLVKHGANVMAINRAGQTTVDMANSPEQRTQPFPETIKLLEGMGAKNNHKCQACK